MSNIATALALSTACTDAAKGVETMQAGSKFFSEIDVVPTQETINALLKFMAVYGADVATRVTSVLMSESEINSMVEDMQYFEGLDSSL
jgi:hypothetical protein